ncbi:hypothetical protein niasHT_002591 [Heterodera trifolii]|uniref:Uncharacterized protein n=1 Tax=Heterodera trifolii TaxID=157864 RepID=A0ABD2M0E0_9BILA
MGTQNSKLRQFYRKTLRRRKVLKKHWSSAAADEAAAQLIEMGGEEEEITLLEMLEPRSAAAAAAAAVHSPTNFDNCHELEEMQQLIDKLAGSLRKQLDALVSTNRQKVQHCSVRWKNVKNSFLRADAIPGKERRKLESQTDECRLRSSLLTDKITNCLDYLQNFDTLLNSLQSEQKRKSGVGTSPAQKGPNWPIGGHFLPIITRHGGPFDGGGNGSAGGHLPRKDHDREPPVQESDRDQLVKTLMEIDDPDQGHDREPPVQESDRDQLVKTLMEMILIKTTTENLLFKNLIEINWSRL